MPERARKGAFLPVLVAGVCVCSWLAVPGGASRADAAKIHVEGTGYPPVRARSKPQALLLAKRAAVLDAYRNAVRERGDGGRVPDVAFDERFVAFVRGMTILREEYLADGGVRIEAVVPAEGVLPLGPKQRAAPSDKRRGPAARPGPQAVTLEEWYRLIEGMVAFETEGGRKDKP